MRDLSDEMICEAEVAKAKRFRTPGKTVSPLLQTPYMHTSLVDDNYVAIGAHIDQSLQEKSKKVNLLISQNYSQKKNPLVKTKGWS